jgi:hypothetical protein
MALEELYQEALRLNGYDKQLKLEPIFMKVVNGV